MKPLVTIIVPVYNVEKTIDRCINSIVNQTYENLEILLIDDGSKDTSGEICEIWKSHDKRINVIHKANAGLGMARNTGIDNAKGDYICFCDSDDYIDRNMVEDCVKIVTSENIELLHYGFHIISADGNEKDIIKAEQIKIYSNNELNEKFIPGMLGYEPDLCKPIGLWMSLCGSFISLDLIKRANWRCESERNIISEDMYSLLELYNYVKKAGVTNKAYYYYCENANSLTHIFRADRYEKIKIFYEKTLERCVEINLSSEFYYLIKRYYISYTTAAIKQIALSNITIKQKKKEICKICMDELAKKLFIESAEDNYSLKQRLFNYLVIKNHRILIMLICYLNKYV